MTFKFLKDPRAARMKLPTSMKNLRLPARMKIKKDSVVPLAAWTATENANKEDPADPPGYVYPWYEGNLQEPAAAHLASESNSPSPKPVSNVPSAVDDHIDHKDTLLSKSSLEILLKAKSPKHNRKYPDERKVPVLSEEICSYCHILRQPSNYPTRTITRRCTHRPEICLECLSSRLVAGHFRCPTCDFSLEPEDVREFAPYETFLQYFVDNVIADVPKD